MHQDAFEDQNGEPYGEEEQDGMYGTVTNALADTRANKKRAQEDVKLLANRIALLKLEEKKVSLWVEGGIYLLNFIA